VATPAAPAAGTVLVIDDEANVHELLEGELAGRGYRVLHAASGREGLRLAREARPDAITLDLIMPEVNGWTVLRELKADPKLCDIPVILVTLLGDREMGYALGAVDYLTKPVDPAPLVSVVARHCPGGAGHGHILVVDDDPDAREVLRRTLEKGGWPVAEATNGREALGALERSTPALVLLDLMMPEVDGFQVLEAMRRDERWREIPVVVITAKELTGEETAWLGWHVEEVLRKGAYGREELLAAVRGMIARHVSATAA
jgi:CheY-like chemotaxis protein